MRVKCAVCGLWRGAKPHSGPLHRRILAQRAKFKRGHGRRRKG